MAFDWKKTFAAGKEKAADAFAKATVKGEELLGQAEEAASKFGKDVKAKVEELKQKNDAPKNGG